MKKILLLFILSLNINVVFSQEESENTFFNSNDSINKWTVEGNVGLSKGISPYAAGFYQSNPNQYFGSPEINSFNLGFRRMFSPIIGVKLNFGYDIIKNASNSGSLPFQMDMYSLSVQGVINANRLFKMDDVLGRFGLLMHGGIIVESLTSKTQNIAGLPLDHSYGATEYNGGLVLGVTPQFRLTNRLAVFLDVAAIFNYRQHFNWDGSLSADSNNLFGQMINTTIGLNYSIGKKGTLHGDWVVVKDKNLVQIEALGRRIDEMETLMNDTDKDGVPDYLDVENNSIAGAAVDTKGRMVDLNRNGIPDALESKLNSNYATRESVTEGLKGATSSKGTIVNMINDGYVTTYFDSNKSTPTNVSSEGIDFILSYLRNNPNDTVEIIGHADEISSTAFNDKLSLKRAESVKAILIKAGVDASRLSVLSKGEDTSVEKDSAGARRLVRKVSFKVTEK